MAGAIRTAFGLAARGSLGELLFVVHTYFSLVARLVGIEVLALSGRERDSQPSMWDSLPDDALIAKFVGIDSGDIPRSLTVNNLFEADVFSWYQGALHGNVDLLNAIRDLLRTMGSFAFPRVAYGANPATDILRDLYQSLVPRVLRKALGEFLTPSWLAEACIAQLRSLNAELDGRVLDPTCGTGTFLIPILRERVRRLRADGADSATAADVQAVMRDVVGVDINPVAVTAARVNYVTVLGELLNRGPVTLPVWRADSILVPDAPPLQGSFSDGRLANRPWKRLNTSLSRPFPIPPAFAEATRMALLRTLLERAMDEPEAASSQAEFIRALDAGCGPGGRQDLELTATEWDDAREVAIELHDRLRELRDTNRNGVWARLIENSFAPLFAGRFDVVLGNPPWLTWTKMPTEWRDATRPVWMRYGLWRVPTTLGRAPKSLASTDLASLVFAVALERYAKPSAMVGLLMPQAIITADPGNRAFRQFRLRADRRDASEVGATTDLRFAPVHLDDWSRVKPFAPDAANNPVFLAARVGAGFTSPIPTVRWERAVSRAILDGPWSRVQAFLRPVSGASGPVDPRVPTSAWSFQPTSGPRLIEGGANPWAFGKGLDTRGANGVYFVRVLRRIAADRVLIENDPKQGRLRSVQSRRGEVEAELIYPLLRGRDVERWRAVPSGYIIAPHETTRLGDVLSDVDLRSRFPDARAWLRRFSGVLTARKAPPTRSWKMDADDWCRLDGPLQHMAADHIVVIREQDARPAAAVVVRSYDATLGRTARVLIDHKLVFCAVDSQDEAHYLAAMLNSAPIQDLLASYANTIAISHQTLARLPIPAYDPNDSHIAAVVAAGREAQAVRAGGRAGGPELAAQEGKVDEVAAEVLAIAGPYVPQPQRIRARRRAPADLMAAEQVPLFD